MLGKTRKTNNAPNEERFQKEKSFEPPPAVSPTASTEKTSIGENISIKGTIHGKGNLLIQGSVKGDIDLDKHHLTVGLSPHSNGLRSDSSPQIERIFPTETKKVTEQKL